MTRRTPSETTTDRTPSEETATGRTSLKVALALAGAAVSGAVRAVVAWLLKGATDGP
ncbi:hypothetical protein ACIPQA_05720 [Streptomyces sp. NPDC090109]|uniref:hypothetical protein n=1 Tax=unclassified Streptomyces TaxID=2593676 RepID=UPI00136C904F|nr:MULTISPECIES: hypothetical protein [unclassified Streptomyces]MZE50617.1 hypothetical protein [Streptomyces sp. SID5770]